MNTERMQGLIAYLQMLPQSPLGVGFNMEFYIGDNDSDTPEDYDKTGNDCGTVCCIAGHCARWFGGITDDFDLSDRAHDWSRGYLGLSVKTAYWLFVDGEHVHEDTTLDTAIKAVEFVLAKQDDDTLGYWADDADYDFSDYLDAKENTDV